MKKENISIIPVRTFGAGNMGSILRAMKNFDFTNITAVLPLFDNTAQVQKMAAGAKDHLSYLQTSENLAKTVESCHRVYAFSARKRKGYSLITPHEMAKEISSFSDDTKVALMFGNETNGLSGEEIELSDTLVAIPTSTEYSSLNLASAVLIALYETSLALKERKDVTEEIGTTQKYKVDLQNSFIALIGEVMPQLLKTNQFRDNIKVLFRKLHLSRKESQFTTTLLRILKNRLCN